MRKARSRVVLDNEFVADSLEQAASSLPPEAAEVAKKLRDAATFYRQFPAKWLIKVYNEKSHVTR